VKYLKLGVLICSALGLAGMFMTGVGAQLEGDKANTIILLVAFALPVLMAVSALARPPFQAWQAGVSLACFALVAYKLQIWKTIKEIGDHPTPLKLILIGAGLGVIVSVVAVLRPESKA
jgi:membrane protease YdiL (CAAX protease family)